MEILFTKVVPPRRQATYLRRQRLLDFLLSQADKRLVLVAAPAGYGKTTLLADFVELTASPIAWFTADESDRDLRSFSEYLLAALRRPFPLAGQATSNLLSSTRGVIDPVALADRLAVDLASLPDAVSLVIDDYHLVDDSQEVNRFLGTLLLRLPPGVRFILSGRTIPSLTPEALSFLAAQDMMAGLSMEDLRFTVDEVQALFAECFHLHLPEAELERLARETEGWIVGIRLTTHTIWQGFLREVVAGRSKEHLYTYLADQVLHQQTREVQDFLLGTSILQEMDADLCNNLLDRSDAAAMLRLLENRGLFVVRLDIGERPRYRYHHLFAAFLQDRLGQDPARLAALHTRAGAILEGRGQIDWAVHHYLAAGDFQEAARAIEAHAQEVFEGGRLATLAAWLEALPPQVLAARPQLLRFRGKALLDLGRPRDSLEWLLQARQAFQVKSDLPGVARVMVEEAAARRLLGDFAQSLALSRESLALSEQIHDLYVQARAFRNLGIILCQRGDTENGIAALRQALKLSEEIGDRFSVALNHHDLGIALRRAGDLAAAEYHFREALAGFEQLGDQGRAANSLNSLGVGLHLQGKYEEALQMYDKALEKARQAGQARTITVLLLSKGDVYRDQGRYTEAAAAYDEARRLIERTEEIDLALYLLIAQGDLHRLQGEHMRAAALLRRAYEEARERGARYEMGLAALRLGVLHYEQGDLAAARRYLEESRSIFGETGSRQELARVHLHLARLAGLEGQQAAVLEHLAQAFRHTLEVGTHAFLAPEARRMLPTLRFGLANKVGGEALADLVRRVEASLPERERTGARLVVTGPTPLPLRIYGLGPPRVLRGETAVTPEDWRAVKVQELLFYLLWRGQARREEIGVALWPEAAPAQMQDVFHVTLHRLRRALGAPEWVLYRADSYLFNRRLPFWYDVEEFQRLLQTAQRLERVGSEEAVARYQQALALYQGDFLGEGAPEWALPVQGQLANAYEAGLRSLARLHAARQEWAEAIDCYNRLLQRDYYREDVHRDLLRAYAAQGEWGQVQEHYRRLRRRLREELDVEPEEATRALYRSLRAKAER